MKQNEWEQGRLPVIPIEDERLNMFAAHGVELAAIAGYELPFGSFKWLAVEGLLREADRQGVLRPEVQLVEATSGRTGNALVHRARAYGITKVMLVMKPDVPRAKSAAPLIAGASIMTITPNVGMSPITFARKTGGGGWDVEKGSWGEDAEEKCVNLDQYAAPSIKDLYRDWAVPKVLDEVGEFEVLVSPIGTGGTIIGLSEGFRSRLGNIAVVGAMCASEHEIPGMRDLAGMKEVKQPWKEALRVPCGAKTEPLIKVERTPAFLCAPWLDWLADVYAGPSGGGTFVALCKFLDRAIAAGELDLFRNKKTEKVKALFVVHDDVTPYAADRFATEYALENFHPSTAKCPREIIFGKKKQQG